jgi:hypothetical protein
MTMRKIHYQIKMLVGHKKEGLQDGATVIATLHTLEDLFTRLDSYTSVLERLGFVKEDNTYIHEDSDRTYSFFVKDFTTFEYTEKDLGDFVTAFIKDGNNEL